LFNFASQSFSKMTKVVGVMALASGLVIATPAFEVEARGAPDSFADLAEKLSPSVVNISTTQKVQATANRDMPMPNVPPGSPFEDFFKDFFEDRAQQGPRKVQSLGSGFIIDSDGIVITNNHVIEEADEIVVILSDGTELDAELVGRDPKTDLAVLQVESDSPLPAVKLGDSDAIRVGDWVMAIGNPFGLGGTVTAGIVSARNRDINSGPYDDFIQTDASINRGNSGGPLFNMDGDVVGVNTAIISPSGGSIGIGFSIPTSIAKGVISQLREFGETRRGWLGVRIQAVTPDIAESMEMSEPSGALVAGVDEDGPAKKAGIEMGDVIVKFDGKDVPKMRDLPRIVAETGIGNAVDVELFRDGKRQTVSVEIERLDEGDQVAMQDTSREEEDESKKSLGLTLSSVTDDEIQRFGLEEDAEGVVVVEIDFDSDAAEKVRPGDIIVEVGQQAVFSPEDVVKRVNELTKDSDKPVLLLLNRGGEMTFRSVRPKTS